MAAVAAAIAAVGTTLVVPGLGLVLAGLIAVTIAWAGAGAAIGDIVGALVGWNMLEERVKEYDDGIRNGGILMGVHPRNQEDANHLSTNWKANRAQNVYN